jgi:hypothetical protein
MKYNHITKNGKNLKIGIYTAYFASLDPRFITYQKKVFDKFGIEINQILVEPNLLNRGFNSHGTLLTELSRNEDVDYLIFFDADAIPLKSNFIDIILDRIYGKHAIIGIEQHSNRLPNTTPYAGPACFAISKETYNILGQPAYNETTRSDVAEELSYISKEKNVEVNFFEFSNCEVPCWPLKDDVYFGIASVYEDLIFHNFESRNNSEHTNRFVKKCKEILNEIDLHMLIHIMPYEIDQLEILLTQLKHNSKYLTEDDTILVDILLNLNLVDWDNSTFPKSYFINKLHQLERLTKTWAITDFKANDDQTVLGCVSHRREAIKNTNSKALLTIDADIVISPYLLFHILSSIKVIENTYYILTPQISPLWDDSWKLLVNKNYINEPAGNMFKFRDPYKYSNCFGDVNLQPINGFKFGGGLATVISSKLAKMVNIPKKLGHYGLEDTYMMFCFDILKQKGIDITQYILENEVVVEDHLFRANPYKDYLTIINRQEEFKKIALENFENEINNFRKNNSI